MDLDKLLRSTDAQVRLDLLAPPVGRDAAPALVAPPGPGHPALLATAFAHLLRGELRRRFPHARSGPRLVDDVPARFAVEAPDLVEDVQILLAEARRAFEAHARLAQPTRAELATVAEHALRLGRLEAVVRTGYVDMRAPEADAQDVDDLLAMLAHVPWAEVVPGAREIDLDPAFGLRPSPTPDDLFLVIDGRLLAIRTGKSARPSASDLRRLVAHLILSRARPDIPEVREVGVLFARHGLVWTAPVAPLLAHPAYGPTAAWLLKHAQRAERIARAEAEARAAPPVHDDEEGDALPRRPVVGQQKPPSWVRKRWTAPAGTPRRDEGKAEKKKQNRPAKPPAPRPPPKTEAPRERDEAPPDAPKRKARPDWRKGSAWRRSRGL